MKKALFAGTFNPPSIGHLNIIKRASTLCDKLYVGVAENKNKTTSAFGTQEKKELLGLITQSIPNLEIVSFNELAVDYAKAQGIQVFIRGLRTFANFEHEFQMAAANRRMSGLETLFLMTDERYAHISSTLIREIGSYGHDLRGFVPDEIADVILKKLKKN